jgi:hypothetical protein
MSQALAKSISGVSYLVGEQRDTFFSSLAFNTKNCDVYRHENRRHNAALQVGTRITSFVLNLLVARQMLPHEFGVSY